MRLVTTEAGTFHYAGVYGIKNTGITRCSLHGYPAIEPYYASSGARIIASIRHAHGIPADITSHNKPRAKEGRVTLLPGREAGFAIAYHQDAEAGTCPLTAFKITLPGVSQPFEVPPQDGPFDVCAGPNMGIQLDLSPILPIKWLPRPAPKY
jgi:Protein of unknown function (DUF4232)